jgi:hypothetical protein
MVNWQPSSLKQARPISGASGHRNFKVVEETTMTMKIAVTQPPPIAVTVPTLPGLKAITRSLPNQEIATPSY